MHIDPRRRGAIKFVQKCVEEWGAKGLKLHPSAGFSPEESATLKLIESIADYGIPVITHTGPSIVPTSSRYCDPIYLDKMLLSFPEVNVIAAHMAYMDTGRSFVPSVGKGQTSIPIFPLRRIWPKLIIRNSPVL